MKRAAFTMIELIFVIVILGILASVAIPKLAGVQDDALVSTEDAGIAAARSSVQAIHGTAILRGAADFNITVTTQKGFAAKVLMGQPGTTGTQTLTAARYPAMLSLADTSAVAEGGVATMATAASENTADTLGMVLDAGNRDVWKEKVGTVAATAGHAIAGPATSTLTAGQTDAEYHNGMSWLYNPLSGSIVLQTTVAY